MQRIFTKTIGKFKAGEVRDYPANVWKTIAQSAKKDLGSFSKSLTEIAEKASAK